LANLFSSLKFLAAALLLTGSFTASRAEAPGVVQASTGRDASCEITGTVNYLKKVERSPYSDGTPTTMSVTETHISVTVTARRPHAKNAPASSKCHAAVEENERQVYKLCSSTVPRQGDRILGTEGGSPGSSAITRCLFDVVALPGTKRKG